MSLKLNGYLLPHSIRMRVKYKDNAQGLIEMGINTLEAEREHNNLNAFKFGIVGRIVYEVGNKIKTEVDTREE